MSNIVLHKANTRGFANLGWLKSYHTFSFSRYFEASRMNFGALRVLNDDVVAGGAGFGKHPHDNMEIVSFGLYGDMEHKDSMGSQQIISQDDVQIMSAGTGIYHSEMNKNHNKEVHFLQIWILPKKTDIEPRYQQKKFSKENRINRFETVVSADKNDTNALWINQDAYLSLGSLQENISVDYQIQKQGNGVYAFILNGEVTINDQKLEKRDGFGITNANKITVKAHSEAEVLLIEVPMIKTPF